MLIRTVREYLHTAPLHVTFDDIDDKWQFMSTVCSLSSCPKSFHVYRVSNLSLVTLTYSFRTFLMHMRNGSRRQEKDHAVMHQDLGLCIELNIK